MMAFIKRRRCEVAMEQRVAHAEQELQKQIEELRTQIDELRKFVWQLQEDVHGLKNREAHHEAE